MAKAKKKATSKSSRKGGPDKGTVAPSTPVVTGSKPKALQTINIPATIITELLDLEEIFRDIRIHLALVSLTLCILAQLRIANPAVSARDFQQSESPNWYVKKILSKSESALYVAAAIAIKRTMAEYVSDVDPTRVLEDFEDLRTNVSGEASAKGTLAAALSSRERLRKFRRGRMLEWVGQVQSAPIYRARKIHPNLELLDSSNFIAALPFKLEMEFSSLVDLLRKTAGLGWGENPDFADVFAIPNNLVPLELDLGVSRTCLLQEIVDLNLPPIGEQLPAWRQAAVIQALDVNRSKGERR